MTAVRNLIIRAGADFSSLRDEMRRASKNLSEFKSGVQGAVKGIGAALAGIGVGAVVADATRSAMDVEAAMMQINKVMGQSAYEFRDWAWQSAGAFNMSKAAAIKYGAIFSNLASTFSSGAEDTKDKTIDLLKASSVIASGTGRTMEDVMWRIRSGLLGNTEAIEDLGINVYVNMLKSTEAFKRFAGDKSWDQLDFKTQQLIRYYGIMEQANKKFGAEVNQNTNSRLQGFQAALGNVKLALGQAFLPILNAILPYLTMLANALATVMSYFNQFTRALFGYKDPSKDLKKQSGAVNGLAGAYDAAGDAAEKAGKKAKDASRGVAAFDEVNTLNDPSKADSGAGAGGAGAGDGGGMPNGLPDPGHASAFDDISASMQKAADKIKAILTGLRDFIIQYKAEIIAVVGGIIAGIAAYFLIVNWGAITGAIASAFGAIVAALGAIAAPAVIAAAVIGAIVAVIIYLWETNKQFRDSVTALWNEFSAFMKQIVTDTWTIIKNVWDKYGAGIVKGFMDMRDSILDIALAIWNKILQPIFQKGLSMLKTLWDEHIKGFIQVLGDFVGKLVQASLDIWNKFIAPFVGWLIDKLGPTFVAVFNNGIDMVGNLLGGIVDACTGIFKALGGVIDFLMGAFTGDWSRAWEGLKTVFKGIWDSLVAIVKIPLNLIIDAINALISGLNSIQVDIPDWVADLAGLKKGGKIGFDIPKIPKLARGGIVDGATNFGNFIAGEAGTEMIVPLENTSFTSQLAAALGQAVMGAMGGNSGSKNPILQIDGRTIARIIAPYLDKESTRLGGSMITAK